MNAQIRNMTRGDLEQVGNVLFEAFNMGAVKHGFSPKMQDPQEGASWAWTVLRHGPKEALVAEAADRVVGICCLNPRGDHGGIGPVAVDPRFQGQGIGRQLMQALLARAQGLQSVRLFQEAFNPASFSLYYSLDFLPVAELLDLHREKGERTGAGRCRRVSELDIKDLDAATAYDMPRSKMDRRADLAYYVKWGKVFLFRQQTEVRGYLACLPGSRSVQLGPLVADGEEEAQCLFHHAAGVFHDRSCQTRVLAGNTNLAKRLQHSGFKITFLNLLMVRGSWRPGKSVEAFGRFPEGA